MTHAIGSCLGGIRSLDDMRDRCRIDSLDGCWLWSMGVTHDGQPKAHLVLDGKRLCTTGGRIVWLLVHGPIPAGHVVYRLRCRNKLCLNPAHLRCGTKAEAGAALVASGHLRGNPHRALVNGRNSRRVLDADKVRFIRESNESDPLTAKKLGVSCSTVRDVRLGNRFAEGGYSVFSARSRRAA